MSVGIYNDPRPDHIVCASASRWKFWMLPRMDGWMKCWTEGWTDGRTEKWLERWMEKQREEQLERPEHRFPEAAVVDPYLEDLRDLPPLVSICLKDGWWLALPRMSGEWVRLHIIIRKTRYSWE
jgi:hypothetical protein